MSGRRRASDQGRGPQSEHGSGHAADLDEQSLLGNQALAARMHGGPPDDDPINAARDIALPLVDRGTLALQLGSHGTRMVERFKEILAASTLDRDLRTAIVGRIDTDEAVARDVSSAVVAAFGSDDADLRDAVGRAMDRVVDALRDGAPAEAGWELPDGRSVALDGDSGHADALVVAVGDAVGGVATGAQILAFCQRVQLALLLEDEEEEPVGPDYGTEEI